MRLLEHCGRTYVRKDAKLSLARSVSYSHGGVSLAGHGGRIKINQTLDERLRLLEERVRNDARTLTREAT